MCMRTIKATFDKNKKLIHLQESGFKLDKNSMSMLYSKINYESKTITIEPLDNTVNIMMGMLGMAGVKIKIVREFLDT